MELGAWILVIGSAVFVVSLVFSLMIGRGAGTNDRQLGEYPPDVEQEPPGDD